MTVVYFFAVLGIESKSPACDICTLSLGLMYMKFCPNIMCMHCISLINKKNPEHIYVPIRNNCQQLSKNSLAYKLLLKEIIINICILAENTTFSRFLGL